MSSSLLIILTLSLYASFANMRKQLANTKHNVASNMIAALLKPPARDPRFILKKIIRTRPYTRHRTGKKNCLPVVNAPAQTEYHWRLQYF